MSTTVLTFARRDLISDNDRLHYHAKARLIKRLRERAVIAWRMAGSPKLDRARLDYTVSLPTRRAFDAANWAPTIKALVDGMVHPAPGVRGILPDDDNTHLSGPYPHAADPTPGRYTITLEWSEA